MGAADYGVSEALYRQDPDGTAVELYSDRPQDAWPRDENDELRVTTSPLNVRSLVEEPS